MKLIIGVLVGLVLGSGISAGADYLEQLRQQNRDEVQRQQAEALQNLYWQQQRQYQQQQRMNPC